MTYRFGDHGTEFLRRFFEPDAKMLEFFLRAFTPSLGFQELVEHLEPEDGLDFGGCCCKSY
jgi:hypothetical protein